MAIKLYHHKTSGGAEYLMDTFVAWSHNGKKGKEGIVEGAKYIVRIDGDITKDAELSISETLRPTESGPWIVIETHGGPEYATICTDEQGKTKVFDTYADALAEANDCQDGKIVAI